MKAITKLSILVLIITFITGCAAKKPTHMDLVINSKKELNHDSKKISSPLMLVFYELESAEKFSKFDYWDLLDKSGEKLSSDLVSQTKQIILPNQEQTYKIVFDNRTKFLGVIGKFRDIKNSNWRYVINLDKNTYNYKELVVQDYTILDKE